jgi:hypothetical protein
MAKGDRTCHQAPQRDLRCSSEFDGIAEEPDQGSTLQGVSELGPDQNQRELAEVASGSRNGPERLKRGEPHGRFQGATNLRRAGQSKPSKPGGTARAERVRRVAAPGRWQRRVERQDLRNQPEDGSSEQRRGREWMTCTDADGGANFDNPMRGVLSSTPTLLEVFGPESRRTAEGVRTAQGGLSLRRRSEGHEGRAIGRPDPKANWDGKSLVGQQNFQSTILQGQGGRVEKANDPRPVQIVARPRCDLGHSGEEVNDPVGPSCCG